MVSMRNRVHVTLTPTSAIRTIVLLKSTWRKSFIDHYNHECNSEIWIRNILSEAKNSKNQNWIFWKNALRVKRSCDHRKIYRWKQNLGKNKIRQVFMFNRIYKSPLFKSLREETLFSSWRRKQNNYVISNALISMFWYFNMC